VVSAGTVSHTFKPHLKLYLNHQQSFRPVVIKIVPANFQHPRATGQHSVHNPERLNGSFSLNLQIYKPRSLRAYALLWEQNDTRPQSSNRNPCGRAQRRDKRPCALRCGRPC
jgi:hypothetical protein